ncbi:monooxygenase family protein [Bacillus stratosphericus]|uniref:monooxygenase family protein n=1 Tax=Bacillus stratosphericus TaxID=293386 RepID=UPI0035E45264
MAIIPSMIKELYTHQKRLVSSGLGLRTTTMIQYLQSIEDLLAYAKMEKHLAAWKAFNQRARKNDAVGICHETYQIQAGSYESVYV